MDDLDARIDAANDMVLVGDSTGPGSEEVPARPVDTWQMYADARREYDRKRFPNGATRKFKMQAEEALDGLRNAYNHAKMDVDNATQHGDKMRARLWRQQYMEENFMPMLDSLVLAGSADELLGMNEILSEFDKLTMLEGVSGKGYTEALLRSLYDGQLGNKRSRSDAMVVSELAEIGKLIEAGNIRAAVGRATKILDKINAGENAADDSDYLALQKIVLRGQ
jgi:hypothetical protein